MCLFIDKEISSTIFSLQNDLPCECEVKKQVILHLQIAYALSSAVPGAETCTCVQDAEPL